MRKKLKNKIFDDSSVLGFHPYRPELIPNARENRKNPTPAEKKLWYEVLRNKQFEGYKFLRQKPIDNFILDFYCSKLQLAIEVDGDSHAAQEEYDMFRTARLNEYGISVIRYTNDEVMNNIDGVYDDLFQKISKITKRI
ncbi:MAG: endonuclease domain-containing protein [bacterium]